MGCIKIVRGTHLYVSIANNIMFHYISYKAKILTVAKSSGGANLKTDDHLLTGGHGDGGGHPISRDNKLVYVLSVFLCDCLSHETSQCSLTAVPNVLCNPS